MSEHICYPWQETGHKYRALDGVQGIVLRLYCRRCGRVIIADQTYNGRVAPEADDGLQLAFSLDEPVH